MRKRGEQSRHSENGKRGDRGVAGRGGADGTGVNIDKAKKNNANRDERKSETESGSVGGNGMDKHNKESHYSS